MGEEAIAYCRGYALEAERRMGQLLAETSRAKGAAAGGKKESLRGAYSEPRDSEPTLADLGISKKESTQAQLMASVPDAVFEAVKAGEKTVTSVKREIKEAKREARRDENRAIVEAVPELEAVSPAKFASIVIDPP